MAPGRLKASVPPEHVSVSLGNKKGSVGCSLDIHERVSLNLDWLSAPFPEPQSPSSASVSSSKSVCSPRPGHPSPMSITSDVPERVAISLGLQNKNKWEAPRTPQVLLVEVERPGEEGNRLVTVTIDRNEEEETQYRGGFRDVRDGSVYLHAAAQTSAPDPRPPAALTGNPAMKTRETQASWMRTREYQTVKEGFTQMEKPGCHIDCNLNVTRIPGRYKDSDQWEEEREQAAAIIQKYVRRSICVRYANLMRRHAKERAEFLEAQERKDKAESDKQMQYEIRRRIHPRTGADFDILFQELEAWRFQEMKIINRSGAEGLDRRKLVKELLLKELKLLQAIDKLRTKAAKENRSERTTRSLVRMGQPKQWEMSNGNIIHVQTMSTARASDLMNLYKDLRKGVVSMDERMGVLGYVKWTVQIYDTDLTREILLLIEREADLMYRGRPAKSLSGLRRRIVDLFVMFVEMPDFNLEAACLNNVPGLDFDACNGHAPMRRECPPPTT